MEFCFDIGPISRPDLIDQLARGLDLRTELRSRQKLPRLWKSTDQLREQNTEDLVARRKKTSRITGIVFLLVGVLLTVTGIRMSSGLNGPLVGGIIALFTGISNLRANSAAVPRKCQQMAQKLLEMRRSAPAASLRFTEAGMQINSGNPIPFSSIEGILEMPDLYLLIIQNSAMFLTKDEGDEVDYEAFSAFLQAQPDLTFRQALS